MSTHATWWLKDLPFPLTVNHMRINQRRGNRNVPIKTLEYRSYEEEMAYALLPQKIDLKAEPQAFYALLYAPKDVWFTKKGLAQSKDVDNLAKSLIDSICKTIDFNDKWFFEVHLFKAIGTERVDVCITNKLATSLASIPF